MLRTFAIASSSSWPAALRMALLAPQLHTSISFAGTTITSPLKLTMLPLCSTSRVVGVRAKLSGEGRGAAAAGAACAAMLCRWHCGSSYRQLLHSQPSIASPVSLMAPQRARCPRQEPVDTADVTGVPILSTLATVLNSAAGCQAGCCTPACARAACPPLSHARPLHRISTGVHLWRATLHVKCQDCKAVPNE